MRMIGLATSKEDWADYLKISKDYSAFSACLGIHPCDVLEHCDTDIEQLDALLSSEKVAAVGETGLDYYHPAPTGEETAYHEKQRAFLEQHFELAAQHNLNIVLHTRDKSGEQSFLDCLSIYKKYADQVRAVFHCFPGTFSQAQKVIELGGMVSFTGNVTFKSAKQIQETAKATPLAHFMLETDAPYMAPVPHRGKRNEPAFVKNIAEYIADLKGISLEELSKATEQNVDAFFKF